VRNDDDRHAHADARGDGGDRVAAHGDVACERRAFALAHLGQRIERRVDDRQQHLARLGDGLRVGRAVEHARQARDVVERELRAEAQLAVELLEQLAVALREREVELDRRQRDRRIERHVDVDRTTVEPLAHTRLELGFEARELFGQPQLELQELVVDRAHFGTQRKALLAPTRGAEAGHRAHLETSST
jgi:hypothetical protein